MKAIPLLVLIVISSVCAYAFAAQLQPPQSPEHEQWLAARLAEAESVKAGMSRAELLRVFDRDGGLQRIPASRYVLRSCRLIQVEVDFDTQYGQAYKRQPDTELKIRKISAPYLAYPAYD